MNAIIIIISLFWDKLFGFYPFEFCRRNLFLMADYVQQLKEEFVGSKSPITDDNQVLQRFCAKLEYLLQYDMKGLEYRACTPVFAFTAGW